jgi:hypothetical protein
METKSFLLMIKQFIAKCGYYVSFSNKFKENHEKRWNHVIWLGSSCDEFVSDLPQLSNMHCFNKLIQFGCVFEHLI